MTLMGRVTIGNHNHIYPGAVIGGAPQDITYQGENTEVVLGDHNVIREAVTINRGTTKEEGVTSVGDHCYFMVPRLIVTWRLRPRRTPATGMSGWQLQSIQERRLTLAPRLNPA